METFSSSNIITIEDNLEFPLYSKREISLVKGKGSKVYDSDGREYIDCVAGIGVASLGHSNPIIIKAITEQAQKIITVPEIFYNDTRAKLLELLNRITPVELNRFYFCNSGTETIEAAIKFARISTGKSEFISMVRGFHGRTFGSLSATFNPKYKANMGSLLEGFHFTPFNNFEKLRSKVNENTAGIILEIVQGNGGIYLIDDEFLSKVRQLCNEKGILLIFDEVQSGLCRTGRMFAFDHYEITPDLLCLAKGIAAGLPFGVVAGNEKIKISQALHGSTFGGNPLVCASSIATINYMLQHSLCKHVSEMGDYLVNQLNNAKLPFIRKIRHLGLMIGIECKQKVRSSIEDLQNEGILVNSASSKVIRLLPPLIISKDEIDLVCKKIIIVLSRQKI